MEILYRAGGPVETGMALNSGQLLHIHLRTMPPDGQALRFRSASFRDLTQSSLPKNQAYRTKGEGAIFRPQFILNPDGAMSRVLPAVGDYGLSIRFIDAAVGLFRRTTPILRTGPFSPFGNCVPGGRKLNRQLRVTLRSTGIQSLHLLALFLGKSGIAM